MAELKEIKNFINLTNGIEYIPNIVSLIDDFSFIRIQSTTLENKDWVKLFNELDYNFLMWLARGYDCFVYDYGTNRPFSKTIYQGLPIIEFVLNKLWYGLEIQPYRLTRKGGYIKENKAYQEGIYNTLFTYNSTKEKKLVKSKLNYFKRYASGKSVRLFGVSHSTDKDGNTEFYKSVLDKYV